jgi:hypothetical protein
MKSKMVAGIEGANILFILFILFRRLNASGQRVVVFLFCVLSRTLEMHFHPVRHAGLH